MVGITGTKGKTTTSTLCSYVLDRGGHSSGMISTADVKVAAKWSHNTTRQTTPEALEIQELLNTMVHAGCDYAVVEASSHALSARWDRVGGCDFDVAVFTNVTHEHLDYHGTIDQYRRDKARLFELLHTPSYANSASDTIIDKRRKIAIINLDDPHAAMFIAAAGPSAEIVTYAIDDPTASVRAIDIDLRSDSSSYSALTPWGKLSVSLKLPGRFNVLNSLAALCVGLVENISPDECVAALAAIDGVRGRMERINQGQPFTVLVDYAHNPDSFEQVMSMLRPLTPGRLISVFGSAGERDIAKRAVQGAIAGRYCDFVIITDEDPRDEDRDAIIEMIAQGVQKSGKQEGLGYLKLPDRSLALRTAFEYAHVGDTVLLLGKGHETSIVYEGGRKVPWLERVEAMRALTTLGYSDNGANE
ncbi:MAG: UDP-N-acetylmuramoyl-L-alanyl-D-glutamate--2,6-diaminopimelate ligase [Herpetosiphon sp.]